MATEGCSVRDNSKYVTNLDVSISIEGRPATVDCGKHRCALIPRIKVYIDGCDEPFVVSQ